MRVRTACLALTLATWAAACADSAPPSVEQQRVDALFAEQIQTGQPGCAIGVARGDEILYRRGYGVATLDHQVSITPDTVFDVGSVTKQVTASTIMLLALDGALSPNDDIRTYLPELPDYGAVITIRHLLHHTSGIRDYLNLMALGGREFYAPISHQDIVDLMARQRALNAVPGARYRYSNTGYMLLATIVERVSRQTFGTFARERIFQPLGMTRSFLYENAEQVVPDRSTGYAPGDAGQFRMVHNYSFAMAGDLLRWSQALATDAVAGPEFTRLMLERGALGNGEPLDYAAGLTLGEYRGLGTVGHGGSTWGFRAQVVRFPDDGVAIAVLCNREDVNPRALVDGIADLYLADQLGPRPEPRPRRARDRSGKDLILVATDLVDFTGDFYSEELDATYHL
jgi:CubicO group peptidase (beta-lactamase class C family)